VELDVKTCVAVQLMSNFQIYRRGGRVQIRRVGLRKQAHHREVLVVLLLPPPGRGEGRRPCRSRPRKGAPAGRWPASGRDVGAGCQAGMGVGTAVADAVEVGAQRHGVLVSAVAAGW
jgi:hypothetical protein